jgi:hypothetical protein
MKITARMLLLATALITACESDAGDTSTTDAEPSTSDEPEFCPNDGSWSGTTDQSEKVSFTVTDCKVSAFSFTYQCGNYKELWGRSPTGGASINEDETFWIFDASLSTPKTGGIKAFGVFKSKTEASGFNTVGDCTDRKTGDALVVTWDASYGSLAEGDSESVSTSTGIGTPCAAQGDCKGQKADYCAIDPTGKNGICTVQNCKPSSNDCPVGYTCCEFIPSLDYPDICMPNAQWEQYHAITCVN